MSMCEGGCPMCCVENHPPPVPDQRAAAWALGFVFGIQVARFAMQHEGEEVPAVQPCQRHAGYLQIVAESNGLAPPAATETINKQVH